MKVLRYETHPVTGERVAVMVEEFGYEEYFGVGRRGGLILRVSLRRRNGVNILDLEGKFFFSNASYISEVIKYIVANTTKPQVIFNAEKMYIDGSGLGAIFDARGLIRDAMGRVVFTKMSKDARKVLTYSMLAKLLEWYENVEEALASFG